MAAAAPLAGRSVLVTRPRHQAQGLIDAVQRLGGEARVFPTLAIAATPVTPEMIEWVRRLGDGDSVIFISPNAVECGMPLIEQAGGLPGGVAVAAVGRATQRSLTERGVGQVIVPQQGADSEALLALPLLQSLSNRTVLIIRGVGGRELLGNTLTQRGARVVYAEVYRRVTPDDADRARLLAWLAAGGIDVVTTTSAAGLENLLALAGAEGGGMLLGLPLVVVSGRMLQLAERLGFRGPIGIAEGAGEDAVSRAVVALVGEPT